MTKAGRAELERKRILVVEDEDDVRRLVVRILSTLGECEEARNGADALARLQQQPTPDLVVSDVMMPVMDGLTLVRRMKAEPHLARIPVLLLTAKNTPRDVVAGINVGARHYVTKPFKSEELLDKARRALGSTR
ncbi:MAG: response regulator [Myxococcota bacterium]|nr:response regulator [Myxococcota bacterium]MDW8362087.1 response regulator [Myxococcales bacterium]